MVLDTSLAGMDLLIILSLRGEKATKQSEADGNYKSCIKGKSSHAIIFINCGKNVQVPL
jgi:hypothetical protein